MTGILGEFRIGEDLAIALDATAGDTSAVSSLSARMKPAEVSGNRLAIDHDSAAIPLTVTPRGADGWILSLGSAATAALAPGIYGIDAALSFAGSVEITERTAFVALSRAAVA